MRVVETGGNISMKKKVLAMIMAGCMALSLAGCGSAKEAEKTEAKKYKVGICQIVQHVALDAATKGFEEKLVEILGEGNVEFDEQNAQGDSNTCATIINGFTSKKVDLILANATPPLQAAAAGTSDIPILGTSVTDYATALEITDWTGTVGGNISGTSDLAPLDEQAKMLNELFPEAKNVGLLYCSAEPNSKYQCDTITTYLEDMGYTVTPYTFSDSNDITTVCTKASDECDVIYIPTDNTAAANTELINNICRGKTPIIAGEEGIAAGCGVATLSISYYDLGATTGEMAAKILKGEADISTMPVEFAPNVTKKYNEANMNALNLEIPEGYEKIEQ